MVQNIEDVIHRGEALNSEFKFSSLNIVSICAVLDDKAAGLATLSKKYRQDARYLNMKSWYTQLAIGGVVLFMLLLYFRFWW